jgi:putative hemolysin
MNKEINQNTPSTEKAYSGHKFTYTSPHDSWLKRGIIGTVENLTGRKYLQQIYEELHEETPNPFDVWENAMNKLDIKMDYDHSQLEKAPKTGPVIFVANHPFGVVDGAIMCHLVTRVRRDYFLLVNEVLSREPIMKGHLLPVDFRGNDEALQINLRTKELTTERLRKGEALAIFPSGGVATAMKFFGEIQEFPWRRFICTRIHETKCTVVPIYFHGKNSRLFQFVSKFSMNLRLGLLLHEIMNKRGETIKIEVGDPITYDEMEQYEDRQKLIEFLYKRTMALGGK